MLVSWSLSEPLGGLCAPLGPRVLHLCFNINSRGSRHGLPRTKRLPLIQRNPIFWASKLIRILGVDVGGCVWGEPRLGHGEGQEQL